jgi:hypothetical protein
MQPALFSNDLVVAYRQPEYFIGDVVIYSQFGGSVIHKIIKRTSPTTFITRGINNGYQDSWTVHEHDIRGKMLFVIPQLGGFFVLVSTNPLFAGFAGVFAASLVMLPPRKAKLSQRLLTILNHSSTESRRIKPWMSVTMTLLWVLVVSSLTATALQLLRQVDFYPQIALSLGALVVSFVVLIGFWEFNGDGRGLPEPQRSIAMLGPRLHRIAPDVVVTPAEMPLVELDSAARMRGVKEHGHLPVLHQIDAATATHSFYLLTDEVAYVWRVVAKKF